MIFKDMKRYKNIIHKRAFCLGVFLMMPFVISACSGNKIERRDPQVVTTPDTVSLMLAEAADKASNALEELAAIEQSRSPAVAVQPIHNAPPELTRAMTITWIGPVEQLLKKLADRASYTYIAVGDKPPSPLVVSIDVENKPVIDILRDAGLQLGVRGDVKVDSTRRMVELHYAPVTGLGR